MLAALIKGFAFGLTTAPLCALTCVPIIVPLMASDGRRGVRANAARFGEFLGGRFLGYVLFGALAGALGGLAGDGMPKWAVAVAYGAIGLAMLLAAAGKGTRTSRLCLLSRRISGSHAFPAVLGALTGISLCPPFLLAVTDALNSGGWLAGATLFVGFFAGTSIIMAPAVFVGMASAWRVVRSLGTVLCAFAGLFFITLAVGLFVPPAPVPVPSAEDAQFAALLPGAVAFDLAEGDVTYRIGRDASGETVGYVFNTHAVAPKESEGFNGPLPLMVGMDAAGRVTGIKPLKNDEDPSFSADVLKPGYLNRFTGATPAEAAKVDAVSGATWTSNAVIKGVSASGAKVAQAAGIDVGAKAVPDEGALSGIMPVHVVMLLIVAVAVFGRVRRIRWLRHVTMLAAIATLGFWWSNLLSVKHLGDLFRNTMALPGMLAAHEEATVTGADVLNGILRALPLILGVGVAFFLGRVWCGWVCPFGAVTEYLGRIVPKRFHLRVPGKMDRAARKLKIVLLLATPVLLAATGVQAFMAYEPFNDTLTLGFLREGFPLHRAAWLGFLALASLVSMRFYCKYLCPVGAGLGFVSEHRVIGRRQPAGCRTCAKCGLDCMVAPEAVAPPNLSDSECLACEACRHCPRFPASQAGEKGAP